MIKQVEEFGFREGGYFYDMVGSFLVGLTGLEATFRQDNPLGHKEGAVYVVEGKVGEELNVEPYKFWLAAGKGQLSSREVSKHLCCMLMNTAYESVKELDDKSEIFDFFRHVRNASSHKGEFFFKEWEPKRKAAWRGKRIDESKMGEDNPLHGTSCFFEYLGAGDCIWLLQDIEKLIAE